MKPDPYKVVPSCSPARTLSLSLEEPNPPNHAPGILPASESVPTPCLLESSIHYFHSQMASDIPGADAQEMWGSEEAKEACRHWVTAPCTLNGLDCLWGQTLKMPLH